MSTSRYIILIIHQDRRVVEILKATIKKSKFKSIFLVAESLSAIPQKITWRTPDLIIANSNKNTFCEALKAFPIDSARVAAIPTIFIKNHQEQESVPPMAKAACHSEQVAIDDLDVHLHQCLMPPSQIELEQRRRHHQSEVTFHKAIALLEADVKFME